MVVRSWSLPAIIPAVGSYEGVSGITPVRSSQRQWSLTTPHSASTKASR
jgi:hypothetical protein